MTIEEVLRDTRARFERGDDSQDNVTGILVALREYFPDALTLEVPDAVETVGVGL